MSSNLKMYGYLALVQLAALLGYMQLNLGKPKDEAYIIGACLLVVNGIITWLGRSPANPIKKFQAPKPSELVKGEAGARKHDPNKVNEL